MFFVFLLLFWGEIFFGFAQIIKNMNMKHIKMKRLKRIKYECFGCFVHRRWWRVIRGKALVMSAMWTTPTVMEDVSHAYITLIRIGMPRYVTYVKSSVTSEVLS